MSMPTGTITFLMTDVVGSTARWERHPSSMAAAIERHDRLVESTVAGHGGTLVKSKGEVDQEDHRQIMSQVRAGLTPEEFDSAWRAGRQKWPHEAVKLARSLL